MKNYKVKDSLIYKLLSTISSIYFTIVLLITGLYVTLEYQQTKADVRNELKLIGQSFQSELQIALEAPDNKKLRSIGRNILKLPQLVSVQITDALGNSLFSQGKNLASSETTLFSHEFTIDGKIKGNTILLAKIKFYSDSGIVFERIKPGIIMIIIAGVIKSILLFALLYWAIKKFLLKPLKKYTDDLEDMRLDNLHQNSIDLHQTYDNEFKAVEATTNQMFRQFDLDKKELLKVEYNYQSILEKEVSERTHELELSNKQLNTLAATDPLTHIRNRRSFFDIAEKYFSIAVRTKEKLSLMMLDLDHFKSVNDKFGHASGDEVLKEFTRIVKTQLRESDLIARYGGEEFVIVLANTGIEGAEKLAEKIRSATEANFLVTDKGEIQVTISIGLSELVESDTSLEEMLSRSDKALYLAKGNGRNRIEKMLA